MEKPQNYSLGKFFVRDLLEKEPDGTLYLLVRGRRDQTPEDRLREAGLDDKRIVVVPSDITDDNLPDLAQELPAMDEFWHIAGLTTFNESRRPQLVAVNVEGTRHALALAECLQVTRYYHISTAYVAGICDGPVPEDGLLPNPVFRNPYEETKYEAEKLVRASALPWIIVRPSIIMGHSETGEVESDKMVYGVARVMHSLNLWVQRDYRDRGGIPSNVKYRIRARHETRKNYICVDDCVRLLASLRICGDPRKTYHCCHPDNCTSGNTLELIWTLLSVDYVEMAPDFSGTGCPKQEFITRGTGVYEPYMLEDDPSFDLANTMSVNGWSPSPMNEETLRFLLERYLKDLGAEEAKKRRHLDTSLDLERLPDIKNYGNFTLAYETMSHQVHVFRTSGAQGYLAYGITEKTAMIVGDPVSDQPAPLLNDFLQWTASQNLNLCALQVHHETAAILRELRLAVNKMGIETSIDLAAFDPELRGRKYGRTREMRNIARRFDATVVERPIDLINPAQVMRVSNAWIAGKKNRNELRFLVREISLVPEPGMRHLFLRYDKLVLAYVFFAPLYDAGRVSGYYATVERYDFGDFEVPGGFNAVHHIACEFARTAKAEGCTRIALGMSPLHDVENSTFNDNPVLMSLFRRLYDEAELYAFKGIAQHKSKYPCRIEEPVYFASVSDTTEEGVLDIFRGIGFLDE